MEQFEKQIPGFDGKVVLENDSGLSFGRDTYKIHWYEWNEKAFALAKADKKLIFLNIVASWCLWCRLMEEKSFSDPTLVFLLNKSFIPIRVDADRLPQIQIRYLAGGLPTNCVLTPEGKILASATYLNLDQLCKMTYRFLQTEVNFSDAGVTKIYKPNRILPTVDAGLNPVKIKKMWFEEAKVLFDPIYGGFGRGPKFAFPEAVEVLLWLYKLYNNDLALRMALITLEKMAQGEIFDQKEYGFFRFAATRKWGLPAPGKILTDNAGLFSVYLSAYGITNEWFYVGVAEKILHYLRKALIHPAGAFFGSQGGTEKRLPPSYPEGAKGMLSGIDETIYTNWNAQMIEALYLAYQLCEDNTYYEMAEKALQYLLKNLQAGNGYCHFYTEGKASQPGYLGDQVYLGKALLTAYETSGNRMYLNEAKTLANYLTHTLEDRTSGGFFDVINEEGIQNIWGQSQKPLQENAVAARFLIRLGRLMSDEWYLAQAEKTLQILFPQFQKEIFSGASYMLAVEEFYLHPIRVVIVGNNTDPRTRKLQSMAFRHFIAGKIVQTMDPAEGEAKVGSTSYPARDVPVAYVCCEKKRPEAILDAEDLRNALKV